MATDLLADLLLESLFDAEEIKREQQVVLQEISQAEDTPDDFIHDLFNLKFWAGHPLALPIAGSIATVTGLDRALMTSFMNQRYRAERVFVAAAGKVEHDSLVAQCERLFGAIQGNGKVDAINPPKVHSLVLNHEKQLEQAHICMGGPGISQTDKARYAAYLLNTALGGGMSSRLFQEVREKRGKVYSIFSFLSSHIDCGYFGIYAGTNPEWVDEVLEITLGELKQVAREGLKASELERAKSQLKGNLLLGLESTDSRMNRLARNEIYFRRDIPVEELARDIEAVTNDQVIELAGTFFDRDQMALVVLGDLKGRELPADIFSAL
jgi:predicted Zn-dependent peptidase